MSSKIVGSKVEVLKVKLDLKNAMVLQKFMQGSYCQICWEISLPRWGESNQSCLLINVEQVADEYDLSQSCRGWLVLLFSINPRQLQPKQPSLHWCHFVAGLIAIFAGILNLFKAESIAGSSARCTAASWLLCPMEMSASDVWQDVMGGRGWINCSFCASSGIWSLLWQRHVSPQSGPCCF